jgi:hypothetical protein
MYRWLHLKENTSTQSSSLGTVSSATADGRLVARGKNRVYLHASRSAQLLLSPCVARSPITATTTRSPNSFPISWRPQSQRRQWGRPVHSPIPATTTSSPSSMRRQIAEIERGKEGSNRGRRGERNETVRRWASTKSGWPHPAVLVGWAQPPFW